MSQYTMTLHQIITNEVDLFDFDFPLFDEGYRTTLQQKIIDNYLFREIGFETVGRFKHELRTRLQLIMPYYNQLYESTLIEYDPLFTYKIEEVYTRNMVNEGKNKTSSTNKGDSKTLYSDTPQGRVEIGESEHVTEITENDNEDSSDTETDSDDTGNEEFDREMKGNLGTHTYNQLLKEFRETFINVDRLIIDELKDLFMRVY